MTFPLTTRWTATQVLGVLRELNRATFEYPKPNHERDPLLVACQNDWKGTQFDGYAKGAKKVLPTPTTEPTNLPPRLLALDAEMIERSIDNVRLPVKVGLVQYDYDDNHTLCRERILFNDFVNPASFDANWLAGPTKYDYKEQFVGVGHDELQRKAESMTTIEALQDIVLAAVRPNTFIVGHALAGDLKAMRLHGEKLRSRIIDTERIYRPLGDTRSRKLRDLVSIVLLPTNERWSTFQESGQAHPPKDDAEAALELVKHAVELDIQDASGPVALLDLLVTDDQYDQLIDNRGELINMIRTQLKDERSRKQVDLHLRNPGESKAFKTNRSLTMYNNYSVMHILGSNWEIVNVAYNTVHSKMGGVPIIQVGLS